MLTIVGTTASDFLGFRQVPPNGMWLKCPLLVSLGAWRKPLLSGFTELALFDDAPSLNCKDYGGN